MSERMTNPEQRWRPISLLPAFRFAVGRAAKTAAEQAGNMRLAIAQPDAVDRFELARMQLVYQDTALNVAMCREQLQRWREEDVASDQQVALDLLDEIVQQWADDTQTVLDAIKTLMHPSRG
ncbi:hypothetical protein [Dyella mobilis]|uniref:hypothetical protein n=1 Tax=Dyella mobilis TaxID=1849582 RepID=UPI0024E0EE41|nr:hypothetical protein [Dyella mobilis]